MASLVLNLLSLLARTVPIRPMPIVRTNKHDLPLPDICHQEIPDSVVGERAVFVIGDVHGCLDEMNELIDKAKSIENDTLFVFVGDLVNNGPYSVGVVRKIREMGLDGNAYAVRGNHDEIALKKFRNYKANPDYNLSEGYDWIKGLSEEDADFLNALPYTISITCYNAIVVHAGIVPGKPLEMQKLNDLTTMRNIIDSGDAFESEGLIGYYKPDKGVAWAEMWPGPEHVYFGHDGRRRLQFAQFATGLDTGCVYGDELTGVFINKGRQFLYVKSKQVFKFDQQMEQ